MVLSLAPLQNQEIELSNAGFFMYEKCTVATSTGKKIGAVSCPLNLSIALREERSSRG
jgi:hypothetical protein